MGVVCREGKQIAVIWFLSFENISLCASPTSPHCDSQSERADSFIFFFSLIRVSHLLQQSHNSIKNSWREALTFGICKRVSEARGEKKIHCEVHCPYSISISISVSPSLPPSLLFFLKQRQSTESHFSLFLFFSQPHSNKQLQFLQKWTAENTVSLNL